MITGLCDEYPQLLGKLVVPESSRCTAGDDLLPFNEAAMFFSGKRRELFVGLLLGGIYLCALPTCTYVSIVLPTCTYVSIVLPSCTYSKCHITGLHNVNCIFPTCTHMGNVLPTV
jgi:hypothetical protein